MASSKINSIDLGPIWVQSGLGNPDHIGLIGTQYTDLDTALVYTNVDGFNTWSALATSSIIPYDTYVSGMTFNNANYDLSLRRNDGVILTQNLGILASDMTVTGGTYNPTTGVATFTNNTGGTFNVTGFLTGMTDTYVTGGTYSSGTTTFTNSTGGTFSVTGFSTGNTSGSGSNGQIAFWTGVNSQSGDSSFTWDNTTKRLGINNTLPQYTIDVNGLLVGGVLDNIIRGNSNADYVGMTINATKSDGTGQADFIMQKKGVNTFQFGCDYASNGTKDFFVYDATNLNTAFYITNSGEIRLGSPGTASSGGYHNTQKLTVKTSGTVLVNTTTDNGVDRLQVNGSIFSTAIKINGGLSNQFLKADGSIDSNVYRTNDIFVTGGTYSSGTTTYTNNTGGTFSVTGLTIVENQILSGNTTKAPSQAIVHSALNLKQSLATGYLTGLTLSAITTGTCRIQTGAFVITNYNDLNNIIVSVKQVTTPIDFTPTYLNTFPATYVALDENLNVIQKSTPFTNAERRTLASIGAVIHTNLISINTTNEIKAPIIAPPNQIHDIIGAIGSLNLSGNTYSANGANMQINKSAGVIWGLGINAANYLNPHELSLSGQTGLTFRYRLRDISLPNGESADTNIIDPDNYDNAGVKTIVPNNRFTIQRINLFQSGLSRIQYGQNVYQTMADAKTFVQTETFVTEKNISDNAIFRAFLIIKKGTTDLTAGIAADEVSFIPVDKFGNVVGGASVALTSALISATLGYTPANDASVIHTTGNETKVGNLSVSGTSSATTISAINYIGLPTDIRLTGGTYSSGNLTFTNNTGGTFSVNGLYTGLTNSIIGSGSTGQVSYWNSASGQTGSSNFTWDGTNINLGTTNGLVLSSVGTNRSMRIGGYTFVDNLAGASFYPNTGVNVGSSFTIIPKGTGYTSTIKSQLSILNTDLVADANNYEHMSVRAGGAAFVITTGKVGSGVLRPLLLSAGYGDSTTNPNQIWLYTDGRVGINTSSNNNVDRFQVNGTVLSTQFKLSTLNTAPSSSTDTGTLGEIRVTSTYIYVCTATNTWVRTPLTTW